MLSQILLGQLRFYLGILLNRQHGDWFSKIWEKVFYGIFLNKFFYPTIFVEETPRINVG